MLVGFWDPYRTKEPNSRIQNKPKILFGLVSTLMCKMMHGIIFAKPKPKFGFLTEQSLVFFSKVAKKVASSLPELFAR